MKTFFISHNKKRKKFQVNIYLKTIQKSITVGWFSSLTSAIIARNTALRSLLGEHPLLHYQHTLTLRKLKSPNTMERIIKSRKGLTSHQKGLLQ